MSLLKFEVNSELNLKSLTFKTRVEPCCEQITVRKSEQRIPPTSCRRRSRVSKQMLFGLRYYYLLVDKTITNCTEALQLINHARGTVFSVTKRLPKRWPRKRGGPKGGHGIVSSTKNANNTTSHSWDNCVRTTICWVDLLTNEELRSSKNRKQNMLVISYTK